MAKTDLDVAPEKGLGHYTHEKNPVAAAGLAAIAVIEEENLAERAANRGAYLLGRLERMRDCCDLVGDARGIGLLAGLDLVKSRKTKERALEEADRVMYESLKRGLSFKTSQGSFIPLSPPLNISRKELDTALDILEEALDAVRREAGK
jgi:4-aminobutyrate aminotransferase